MIILNNEKPMFQQIIEMIEDDILSGTYKEDDLILSTPQISKLLSVNPTTAQRAITVLTDRSVIYKKRGVGMAVTKEARGMILEERRTAFYSRVVPEFVRAAQKIGVSGDEVIQIIRENFL
jgi:DNA-binding transcriptional regulator YhcF (GntR family)